METVKSLSRLIDKLRGSLLRSNISAFLCVWFRVYQIKSNRVSKLGVTWLLKHSKYAIHATLNLLSLYFAQCEI